MDAWLDGLSSAHTRDAYGRDVAAFIRWCDAHGRVLLEVRLSDIGDYRDDCDQAGIRPATIARRLSALASFFDHALVAQAVDVNPVAAVERPLMPREPGPAGLDDRDAAALLASARETSPKTLVLVTLLLLEGLKLAEALALDVDQLGGSARRMHVTVSRRGTPQLLLLDRRTAEAIRIYLAGRTHGPLLVGKGPTGDGPSRLTRFGADFLLKSAAADAGLEARVSANRLRRTHIATSHRDGASVEQIAERVGHLSARDTRRYLP